MEEAENVRISVRNLVEFILRSGDIDNSKGSFSDPDAMQMGSRLHRKIQGRMGSNYQPEVFLTGTFPFPGDGISITVEGRADGIIQENSGMTVDEIKGVYVPFWLFDTDATADIRYHATRTRFWSDSDYDYTETSHYSVFRAGSIGFDQIPVDGSSKIDNDLTESLEPYVISDAVDFETPYLAGYVADKYDVSAEESVERANQRVKRAAEDAFRDTVAGYDSVTPEDTHIQLKGGKTHYALFPVWLLSTTWKGNHYLFGMNGQTGKFVGNLPVDKGIFAKWFIGLTAGFSVAAYAIAWLVHTL